MMIALPPERRAAALRARAALLEAEALPLVADGQRAVAGSMFYEAARLRALAKVILSKDAVHAVVADRGGLEVTVTGP